MNNDLSSWRLRYVDGIARARIFIIFIIIKQLKPQRQAEVRAEEDGGNCHASAKHRAKKSNLLVANANM
jgi:hypothetical protein